MVWGMETNTKPIRVISIISSRPEDNGKRVKLGLFKDGSCYRWFGGNPGERPVPCREQDSEVSGNTIAEACAVARQAWAGSAWGLRAKSANF